VFIVAKTAMIGRDTLKKTSENAHLLDREEVKQIPLPESTKVGLLKNCRSATSV
jgi:hypothetical protein